MTFTSCSIAPAATTAECESSRRSATRRPADGPPCVTVVISVTSRPLESTVHYSTRVVPRMQDVDRRGLTVVVT